MKTATTYLAAIALTALVLGTAAHPARADLIVNGGFEFPPIGNVFYQNYGTFTNNPYAGPSFQGWAVTTNNVDIVNPIAGWNAPAYQGAQILDLVGYGSTGAISQSFATTPGQIYLLNFAYGNNPGSGAAQASVTVFGSSSLLSALVFHDNSATGNLNWNLYSGSFVANSETTTLAFNTTLGGNNGGILLDAVAVSAVPEPATWALMIFGFAGVAMMAYRRSRKSAVPAASS
jgi:uncharacterized protein DUF642/PEP-CTERM motif-containing protein